MLVRRSWVEESSESFVQSLVDQIAEQSVDAIDAELHQLAQKNQHIHERDCFNLNPASNAMNPRAEAFLCQRLGSRPSLGYPGNKMEMGLEAIERIEVIAAELAAEVFGARYAEIRVGSGALANLYVYMATSNAGDRVIAPPESIAGHITHHKSGAAGLYGIQTCSAPIDYDAYSIDLDRLRDKARQVKPKVITVGGSLNLTPHPVSAIREIADEVGAWVLYDAAHMSGLIAGKAWQQPLQEGAHVMTMSTYKSFAGPPSGLIVTNESELAERFESIAFPGLTANFDAAKSAALAMTLLDWKVHGESYAQAMVDTATVLANSLNEGGIEIFTTNSGFTTSHQFAAKAHNFGGGQKAAKRLRKANILAMGIGLPVDDIEGDVNGLRMGTNELVRWGMSSDDMPQLARFITQALKDDESARLLAPDISAFRQEFSDIHYVR